MKKTIGIIGADAELILAISTALKQSNDDLIILRDAFNECAPTTLATAETFTIFNRELEDLPAFDPTLPWPKSFQDPKGEKTGTKWCEMSDQKRRQLKAKRKKKRKK